MLITSQSFWNCERGNFSEDAKGSQKCCIRESSSFKEAITLLLRYHISFGVLPSICPCWKAAHVSCVFMFTVFQ